MPAPANGARDVSIGDTIDITIPILAAHILAHPRNKILSELSQAEDILQDAITLALEEE